MKSKIIELRNRCVVCSKEASTPVADVFLERHPVFSMKGFRKVCSKKCLKEALKWGFKIKKDFRGNKNEKNKK